MGPRKPVLFFLEYAEVAAAHVRGVDEDICLPCAAIEAIGNIGEGRKESTGGALFPVDPSMMLLLVS